MVQEPFFSIVIPALNEEKYLPRLLADLSQQSIKDFEVIIVDGQSTDQTVARCQTYKDKLPSLQILTSKIRNVSVQRNQGGFASSGQYLVFNDADNRLPEYFLEGLRYQLRVKPVDLFTTWSLPDTDKNSDKTIASLFNMMLEASQLANTPSAFGAMIGCRRAIFTQETAFDPEVGFAEDTDFVRQNYKRGYTFKVFRDPRYVYSLRRFHKMGTFNILQKSALLNIKYLTKQKVDQKKEYPMGGSVFDINPQDQSLFSNIGNFNKLLKKPKILEKINALLSLEEK